MYLNKTLFKLVKYLINKEFNDDTDILVMLYELLLALLQQNCSYFDFEATLVVELYYV